MLTSFFYQESSIAPEIVLSEEGAGLPISFLAAKYQQKYLQSLDQGVK
jgi:hypothetical protein